MSSRLKILFLVTTSPDNTSFCPHYIRTTIMRIFFTAVFVILGANLIIDLMDSNLKNIIEERNETINRLIKS